ncbi:hypothetical protein HK102_000086 [Quaeritorhiza haematococci]|nr:hypothetical protein HK102_000086 [Quaeritorhiza haematococci]
MPGLMEDTDDDEATAQTSTEDGERTSTKAEDVGARSARLQLLTNPRTPGPVYRGPRCCRPDCAVCRRQPQRLRTPIDPGWTCHHGVCCSCGQNRRRHIHRAVASARSAQSTAVNKAAARTSTEDGEHTLTKVGDDCATMQSAGEAHQPVDLRVAKYRELCEMSLLHLQGDHSKVLRRRRQDFVRSMRKRIVSIKLVVPNCTKNGKPDEEFRKPIKAANAKKKRVFKKEKDAIRAQREKLLETNPNLNKEQLPKLPTEPEMIPYNNPPKPDYGTKPTRPDNLDP